jgi:Zn-dependent M28 family amino/carboxypeptidase
MNYPSRFLKIYVLAGILLHLLLILSCNKEEEIPNEEPSAFISNIISDIHAENISLNAHWLQNMTSRFALNDNRKSIALGIRDKFLSYGYADARLDSFYISGSYNGNDFAVWQYNVLASLNGSGATDSVCVVGAHYDSINEDGNPWSVAPGADDNASGVAAMLEIARTLRQKGYVPRTTIVFAAFAAEELDLYGSADLAQKYFSQGVPVRMMLNLDMIAYEPDENISSWEINIMNYDNSESLRQSAEILTRTYTGLTAVTDNYYREEGDSYSFFLKNFPALFFISYDENPHYHTSDDVTSHCNFEYCSQVARLCCSMLLFYNQQK